MPRRSRKLPVPSARSVEWHPVPLNWSRIERAYGHLLSTEVRAEIDFASRLYLNGISGEATAVPVESFLKKLKRLEDIIVSIDEDLWKDEIEEGEASEEADTDENDLEELLAIVDDIPYPPLVVYLPLLKIRLAKVRTLIRPIVGELSDPEYKGFEDSPVWATWIWGLTAILRGAGLPCGVRKDSDKHKDSNTQSPFLLLVAELQQQFPKYARRYHSDDALAQKITRARRRFSLELPFRSSLDAYLRQCLDGLTMNYRSLEAKKSGTYSRT